MHSSQQHVYTSKSTRASFLSSQVSLSQPLSPSLRAHRQLLPPELTDDMPNDHIGIDQPTLFAHLMKLSQDEVVEWASPRMPFYDVLQC